MQIIGVSADVTVDGVDPADGAERVQGRVIAVAFDDDADGGDPVPSATWFLVVDEQRPAPVWLPHADVTAQRLGR